MNGPTACKKIQNVLRMEYLIRCSKISTQSSEYTSNLKGAQLWSKNQCESVSPTVVQRKVTTCAVERQKKPATRKGIVLQVLATDHCFPFILMNFSLVLFFLSVLVTRQGPSVCVVTRFAVSPGSRAGNKVSTRGTNTGYLNMKNS